MRSRLATSVSESTVDQAQQYPENHPCHHTVQLKSSLQDLAQHLREDVAKITEPKAQALFETTAEVLGGLIKAFEHYERSSH
jgi:hypothetical protein